MEMIALLNDNKEWIFSGIGVTILFIIYKFTRNFFLTKKTKEEKNIVINQNCIGKNNSQIGIQNNYYIKEKDHE